MTKENIQKSRRITLVYEKEQVAVCLIIKSSFSYRERC
jgi:hypothetical protein